MRWNIPTMKRKFLTLLAFVYVQGTLAEEPRLFTIPADPEFTVHRGNPTVFVCKAEVPDPTLITDLKWISPEGLEIGVSDRIFTEISYLRSAKPQNRLEIKSVQETDAGNYTCRLTYGLKKLHRSINLSVEVSIKWIDVPAEQRAVLGKEYNVKCIVKAEAHDVVKVHWLKDGVDVTKKTYQSQYLPQGNGLLIRNVSREDAGIFTCRAKVQLTADFSEKQITLKIIVPPKFKNVIEDIESIEDMSARLDCEAEGEPTPTYEFLDVNGEPIIGRPGFVINPNTGILVIEEVKRENAGEYKCRASSDGRTIEAVRRLRVIINTTKNEMWTWSQRPVNLTCRASSIPNATIYWWNSRYNALIDENDTRYKIYNQDGESTLMVTPENDSFYGEYRCLAENKYVKAEHVITLKKAHVPQPPTQATFQTETATTITFNIVGPQNIGGINLTYYAVQYRKKNEEWIDENPSKEWPIGSPYILENLEPQTTYVFRFFAKNLVGLSTYGARTQRTMPKRAAPEKPDILPTPIGGIVHSDYSQKYDLAWIAS